MNVANRTLAVEINRSLKPSGMRRCSRCLRVKPVAEFHCGKGRPHFQCKTCVSAVNREKLPQRRAAMKERHLLRKYGLTLDAWVQMLESQNFACAICERPSEEFKKGLHVDHDHATGCVRALLCTNCNTAIAHLFEDYERFARAIAYVETHRRRARIAR